MSAHAGMSRRRLLGLAVVAGGLVAFGGIRSVLGQSSTPAPLVPRPITPPPGYMEAAERALAEPFKGITTDGTVVPGLFSIQKTGVSTQPLQDAAAAFLASLSSQQRTKTLFPVDSDEWRRWSNIHRFPRQGVSLAEMYPAQRESALALLKAGLSQRGFGLARDIMRLNETVVRTPNGNDYGKDLLRQHHEQFDHSQ